MKEAEARKKLAQVTRRLARENLSHLNRLKKGSAGLKRPDFIWHYLLQSFATMGRASGWKGLIDTPENYQRLRYETLARLGPAVRRRQVEATCRDAGIRMPQRKADFILGCFEHVRAMGGPEAARKALFSQVGADAKIKFLKGFPGIGPKYARNIMMDVHHPEFRDSIALDVRLNPILDRLGLKFASYEAGERFYRSVADRADLTAWELDRIIFNYLAEVEEHLGLRA